jgi:peptidoglycan/xylan/chitin deacetylase (PgdA/CDA1 family)
MKKKKKKKNTGKQKKLRFIRLCMVVVVAVATSSLFLHPGHTHDTPKPHTFVTTIKTSKPTEKPSVTKTPSSASSTQSTAPTQSTPLAIPGSGIYVAVSGNTLISIAQMFGMSLSTIEALNPQISDPGLIYTGQSIRLSQAAPAETAPVPAVSQPSATVPVYYRIQTTQPVVFLTIDDGIYKEPQAAALMQANNIKASFFLVYRFINDNPSYFADLSTATGSLIEDHTYDHTILTNLTYNQQVNEICSDADILAQLYGRRPVLFRPPGGDFNTDTLQAAAACGMKAVIIWHATVNNGALQYQVGDHLQPGDIVLMHFRTTFIEDMQAFITAMDAQGLHTELLENWIN